MVTSPPRTSGQKEINCMMTLFETMTTPKNVINQNLINSIHWHLLQLFNTRKETLSHLSDYGLPDMNQVYRGMPDSIVYLIREIANTIEKYEPRIHHVVITENKTTQDNHILSLNLSADTDIGKIDFMTVFNSTDPVKIEQLYYND